MMLLRLIPDYMKHFEPINLEKKLNSKTPETLRTTKSGISTPLNYTDNRVYHNVAQPIVENPPLFVTRSVFDHVQFLNPSFYPSEISQPFELELLIDEEENKKIELFLQDNLSNHSRQYDEKLISFNKASKSDTTNNQDISIHNHNDYVYQLNVDKLNQFNNQTKSDMESISAKYKELEAEFLKRLEIENQVRIQHEKKLEKRQEKIDLAEKKYWEEMKNVTQILLGLNPDYVEMKSEYEELLRIKEEKRKMEEDEKRKKLEAALKAQEEEKRRLATLAAEKRARELEELRRKEEMMRLEKERKEREAARKAQEEKERLEREKREREEQERQRQLRIQEEAARKNAPGLKPCSEGKQRYDSALELINSTNQQLILRIKGDPRYKNIRMEVKLTIQGQFNKLTSVKSKIISAAQAINSCLSEARANGDDFYKLALNIFGKSAVKNAETECGPSPAHAYRSALLIVLVFQDHPESIDYIYTRMIKNCPAIAPYNPRFTQDMDKAQYFKLINRGFDDGELEDETIYAERMRGIASVYAAICQSVPPKGSNPYGMEHLWTWLAGTLNSPPVAITPDLITSVLEIAGNKFSQTYGFQFFKLVDYIQLHYLVKLPKSSISANAQLKIMTENFIKNRVLPPIDGSALTDS